MPVLLSADLRFLEHDTGPFHPERPERLAAVLDGLTEHGLDEAVVRIPAVRSATDAEIARVHPMEFIAAIDRFCEAGGGNLDADTVVSSRSGELARLASGAGLDAVDRLRAGEAEAAFLAMRPPGHHATRTRAMGFCLFNHVAVTAAALAAAGERVAIVDFDAHHGNGTQDIFYDRDDVLYVSWHQHPLYPGTGRIEERGAGVGVGATLNLPMPPGATGEHYRRSVETIIAPTLARLGVGWLLISAGFDAHRDDPLTDMGLSSGDYADLTTDLMSTVPPGRVLAFLEGGYDLAALAHSSASTIAAMAGERLHPEAPTAGGPGRSVVDAARALTDRGDG
ncbi:MAG: histone deacetylase [Acidimicrobiales bacterium]